MSNAWFETLGVFDLETTGIDVATSRIVSAHVGLIGTDGQVIEQRDWLADPGIEIPVQASAVHGISTEMARANGRPAAEVIAEIVGALRELFDRGIPVTAYNASYDFTLLAAEAARHGVPALTSPTPVVDPLILDKAMDKFRKGKRTLEAAAVHYNVNLIDAHTAGADAVAAGRVAQAIGRAFAGDLVIDAAELHDRQVVWAREQAQSFQDYMRRTKDPSFTTDGTWPVRALEL
jgi:DNA polymerase III subunit epsilon